MNTNTTAIHSYLSLCNQFGVEPDYIPATTLNEKLGILSGDPTGGGAVLSEGVTRYLVLGNGGHGTTIQNGVTGISSKLRLPQFQGLYNILPLVLRRADNDLTVTEALKYRLRKEETRGGVNYIAYYARVLDLGAIKPTIELEINNSGVITRTPYVHSNSNLTHGEVLPVINNGVTSKLVTSMSIDYTPTEEDLTEIRDACNIIYGEAGFAIISEIGIVNGLETGITATLNGISYSITEIVNAQLVGSFSTGRLLDFGVNADLTQIRVGTAPAFMATA